MIYNKFKINQKGSSFIEIIVAMFVLAIGITALIALQIKSLKNINNLDTKEQIINSINNLSQNMMINPLLNPNDLTKDYSYYALNNGCSKKSTETFNKDKKLSKKDFANNNLIQFCNQLSQIQGLSTDDTQLLICNNDKVDINKENLDKGEKLKCTKHGNETVIKFTWKMKSSSKTRTDTDNSNTYYYSVLLNE